MKAPRRPPARLGKVAPSAPQTGMQLYTADGTRKYLTARERDAFLRQADLTDRTVLTLCMTWRMPAAGSPKPWRWPPTGSISPPACCVESLKKRRTGVFRSVPVPPALLDTLDMVHGIRELHIRRGKGRGRPDGGRGLL